MHNKGSHLRLLWHPRLVSLIVLHPSMQSQKCALLSCAVPLCRDCCHGVLTNYVLCFAVLCRLSVLWKQITPEYKRFGQFLTGTQHNRRQVGLGCCCLLSVLGAGMDVWVRRAVPGRLAAQHAACGTAVAEELLCHSSTTCATCFCAAACTR